MNQFRFYVEDSRIANVKGKFVVVIEDQWNDRCKIYSHGDFFAQVPHIFDTKREAEEAAHRVSEDYEADGHSVEISYR